MQVQKFESERCCESVRALCKLRDYLRRRIRIKAFDPLEVSQSGQVNQGLDPGLMVAKVGMVVLLPCQLRLKTAVTGVGSESVKIAETTSGGIRHCFKVPTVVAPHIYNQHRTPASLSGMSQVLSLRTRQRPILCPFSRPPPLAADGRMESLSWMHSLFRRTLNQHHACEERDLRWPTGDRHVEAWQFADRRESAGRRYVHREKNYGHTHFPPRRDCPAASAG